MLIPDWMHLFDLGSAHYVVGNVLFEMVYDRAIFPHLPTINERLQEVWRRIIGQYATRGTSNQIAGPLELTYFTNSDKPHQVQPLLTSRIKAAETSQCT